MTNLRSYDYACEKLAQARGTLMAPHGPDGETGAFVAAFEIISRLRPADVSGFTDHAARYWAAITRLMDTSGLEDPTKKGLFSVRVSKMGFEERHEFSRNVDELASWLDDYQHTRHAGK